MNYVMFNDMVLKDTSLQTRDETDTLWDWAISF